MTVAAAGAIWYYDEEGEFHYGQSLKLQWGIRKPDGTFTALDKVQPIDTDEQYALAQPALPVGLGPGRGQRGADRRR